MLMVYSKIKLEGNMAFEDTILLQNDPASIPALRYTVSGRHVRNDKDQQFAAQQVVRGRWHKLVKLCRELDKAGITYYVSYDLGDKFCAYIWAE
jgi:hypothetical protein